MIDAKRRKKDVAFVIGQNPTAITVNRTEKVREGGGFKNVDSQLGPFTVRLYNRQNTVPRSTVTMGGTKQVDVSWGLLGDHGANIKAGANVRDTFTVEGLGTFEVVQVRPEIIRGELVAVEAELDLLT